jgi:hypothetical protein
MAQGGSNRDFMCLAYSRTLVRLTPAPAPSILAPSLTPQLHTA